MPRPRFSEPLVPVNLSLWERQMDRLRAESTMTGAPVAALVRRELDRAAAEGAALDGEANETRP